MWRPFWIGRLHQIGVEIIPFVRLAAVDRQCADFQHLGSSEPVLCENIDTLVLALGSKPVSWLERQLEGFGGPVHVIGDCLAPRTAEEAVFEGLKAGTAV